MPVDMFIHNKISLKMLYIVCEINISCFTQHHDVVF